MPDEKPSQLKDFAKLIGSKKGTHPIPPDQYTSFQDRREKPKMRLWSFLVECSIAPGRRKGPAIMKDGSLVTVAKAAKYLSMPVSTAQQAFEEIETECRVRRENAAIWISGDFKLGKQKANRKTLYNLFPKSAHKGISNLREDLRAALFAEAEAENRAFELATADLMAAKRFIQDERQNSMCARYGVNIRREKQKAKRGKEAEKSERERRVLQILPLIQNVVQPLLTGNVVQPAGDFVQPETGDPILIAFTETQRKPTTTAREQTAPQQPQQRFDPSAYPLTDSAITAKFPACSQEYRGRIVRAALAVNPERVNDGTIAQAIEEATKKDQRSAALYLETVPNVLEAWLRDADRRKTA